MTEKLKITFLDCIGSVVTIHLLNNFKFEGELLYADSDFLKILDEKTQQEKFIALKSISEVTLK